MFVNTSLKERCMCSLYEQARIGLPLRNIFIIGFHCCDHYTSQSVNLKIPTTNMSRLLLVGNVSLIVQVELEKLGVAWGRG